MRLSVATAVACLAVTTLSAHEIAAAAIKRDTNIPAQKLDAALAHFAKDRDLQLVYASEEVNGLNSLGAVGSLTVNETLTKLLSGTGLTYRYLDEQTITVQPVVVPTGENKRQPSGVVQFAGGDTPTMSEVLAAGAVENGGFWRRFRLAQAETTAAPSQAGHQVAAAETLSPRGALEEIIVTATKREERLQDVPISITAITADEIDKRRLVNAEDYLRGIPGVNHMSGGYGGPAIIIRGIETTNTFQNFGSGPTTATYFGETPTTNSGGVTGGSNVDIKLVDIARVEVLRGPQGTAVGSSSMGGAVRTIPVAPKLDIFEGKVAGGYSVTSGTGGDNYNMQAVANLPLIKDRLAIRAVGYRSEDSGFYRNVAGSDPAFQSAVVAPFGAQAYAIDKEDIGSYYVVGGRIAALFQATDDLRLTLSYLTQDTETDGHPLANAPGNYAQTVLQVAPEHVHRGQTGGRVDSNLDLANAVMEYDLGWGDLLATYSYLKGGAPVVAPATAYGGGAPARSLDSDSTNRGDFGEIRLATRLDGAWNFLAGLYGEDISDEYQYDVIWEGDPARNPFDPNAAGVVFDPARRDLGGYLDLRDLKQRAAFGEVSWEFLPGLTLTGGARAYDYERSVRTNGRGALFGGNTATQASFDASGTNFRANLSYKPSDASLVYAGWAQGFRLGKPQASAPSGLCDPNGDGIIDGTSITIESTTFVDSDYLDNYELGSKFAFWDSRLTVDAALFRMEWSDIPVSVNPRALNPSACSFGFLANAGNAVSKGVELQANLRLSDAFQVNLGGSFVDARFTDDVPVQGVFADDRLPGSPKVNANLAVQYAFDLAGNATTLRVDTIYVGPFFNVAHPLANQAPAGDYVKVDATARVAINNLNVDLFVRNLTNEEAFSTRGFFEFQGYLLRPRTIGLQLSYDF